MCHEYRDHHWYRETTESETEDEETPAFLSDDEAEDVEVLTDGGDES